MDTWVHFPPSYCQGNNVRSASALVASVISCVVCEDGFNKPVMIQAQKGNEKQHGRHSCKEMLLLAPTLLENIAARRRQGSWYKALRI